MSRAGMADGTVEFHAPPRSNLMKLDIQTMHACFVLRKNFLFRLGLSGPNSSVVLDIIGNAPLNRGPK